MRYFLLIFKGDHPVHVCADHLLTEIAEWGCQPDAIHSPEVKECSICTYLQENPPLSKKSWRF